MFDSLKRLFRKREASPVESKTPETDRPPAPPRPASQPATPPLAPAPKAKPELRDRGHAPAPEGAVKVSLRAVVLKLPDSLKAKVRQPPTGGVQIAVPLHKVLPQLAHGSVKIAFGELRKASPPGVFSDAADRDQVPVDLPLQEILPQLRPDQLPRRAAQKTVAVPDEVTPIFGPRAQLAGQVRVADTPHAHPAPRIEAPAAPPSRPPAARPPAPIAPPYRAPKPAVPPSPAGPLPPPPAVHPPGPPHGRPAMPPAPRPPVPKAPPVPPAAPVVPAPAAAPAAPETVSIPLSSITSGWPETIRQALAGLNAPDAVLILPAAEVEQGLKKGKVVFPWKRVKSLIRPPLRSALPPAIDETQLELPLPSVAPLYLAQCKPVAPRKKVSIAEDIPDVFTGRGMAVQPAEPAVAAPPVPEAPEAAPPTRLPAKPPPAAVPAPAVPPIEKAPAVAAPPRAPTPVAPPSPPVVPGAPVPAEAVLKPAPAPEAVVVPGPRDIGEALGQPGRKNWAPAEIVQRTASLPGLAGALISMQDGLLVASQVPTGLDAEAIAAFVPQIFGRMMQYCKELKFGEGNKLTLVVDDVPLKIYRLGGIFFAALGRSKEHLPDAHLDIVADHLAPQSK